MTVLSTSTERVSLDEETRLLVELERTRQELARWERVGKMLEQRSLTVPSVSRLCRFFRASLALRERALRELRAGNPCPASP